MAPPSEASGHTPGGVQSVHRALDLLEVVAARGGTLTIGEISALTGIPLPTAHRLLRTLVDRGYMRQAPDRRYALGFRLVPLGASAGAMVGVGTERVLGAGRRRPRRDRQPGHARRRPGGLRRPGARPARDADVHRGRTPRAPALHGGRQGRPVRGPRGRRPGAARPHRAAPAHREHDHRHRRVPRPARGGPGARLRARRGRAGGRASAASRCGCPAAPRRWGSPSPGRRRG